MTLLLLLLTAGWVLGLVFGLFTFVCALVLVTPALFLLAASNGLTAALWAAVSAIVSLQIGFVGGLVSRLLLAPVRTKLENSPLQRPRHDVTRRRQ